MYIGSWKVDDLLTFTVVTTRVDTGAATDADSAPAYRIYEDETSTPILTGNMALLDSANTAGFYSEQITLSAANGFEKGKSYNIYISATVNSIAGATIRNFQMEAEVDSNSVSNIGSGVITATAIADNAIDAGAIANDAITSAKIADGAIDAATFAAGAITATVIATGAIDADAVAADAVTEIQLGLSTLTQANIRTAVGLASANLDTQLDALPTAAEVRTEMDNNSTKLASILEDTGTTLQAEIDGVQTDTEDIQSRLPAALTIAGNIKADALLLNGATPNNISTAQVNTEADTALADAGVTTTVTGRIDAAISTRASQTSLDTLDDFVDTEVNAIKLKTDNLPSDPADQSALELLIDALPTAAENASSVWASATRTLTAISDSSGITTLLSRIASSLNISSGKVESNIKQVNDVAITGDGDGTPWGPA
jgi:hypothetical protein